ncbi:MAG: hypothetical protein ABJE47_21315 [bacterium]
MFVSTATGRRLLTAATVCTLAMSPLRLAAQTAAERTALGDRDHAAMDAPSALHHYEEAIKLDPKAYDALCKATREAVDVGLYASDEQERNRLFSLAEQYARRAVEVNGQDAEGHFQLARALGRKALTLGKKDQVKYAGDVRTEALAALAINPNDPGAMHVMGMWNYNVLRLNGLVRFLAIRVLGGKTFESAKWDDAQKFMESATALDPKVLVHHLDLARVYAARDNKEKAREQYNFVIKGTATDYNDKHYKAEAAEELKDVS